MLKLRNKMTNGHLEIASIFPSDVLKVECILIIEINGLEISFEMSIDFYFPQI